MFTNKTTIFFSLFFIGILIYGNTLFNDFVWDDREIIKLLSHLQIRDVPSFFIDSQSQSGGSIPLYRPLTTFFLIIQYTIFGASPFLFHFVQIILHVFNSFLIFYIFKKLLKHLITAYILSVIFLVHPINVEAVAFLTSEAYFTFFGLLALVLTISLKENWKTLILIYTSLLLSLFAKESAILFLVVFFLFKILFHRKKLITHILSTSGILLIYLFFRFVLARLYVATAPNFPIARLSLSERLINIPKIISFYIETFFFPKNLIIGQQWIVENINFNNFYYPLIKVALVFIGLALFGIYLFRKKNATFKVFLFFYIWLLLGLGLHIQILPLNMTVADRWFYFPIVGLLGVMGVFFIQFKSGNRLIKTAVLIVTSLLIVILSIRTIFQNSTWANDKTLFSYAAQFDTQNPFIFNNYGLVLLNEKKYNEAEIYFKKALELDPNYWEAMNNLGFSANLKGDKQKTKEYFLKSIEINDNQIVNENLALFLKENESAEELIRFLEQAVKKFPRHQKFHIMLMLKYIERGEIEKAKEICVKALVINPNPELKKVCPNLYLLK
ncbi:hypothetical protein A3A93_00540 [Candidatus Roizmanbacteria bacterium RIFCSPLOWO2_01_FULL_38_12]|uniref:Uncharacterized protein n=1 Tax=Candidatus Roizmanbacteria bacterium RIFCSPLOWO2_01_FULL_38_12 TaxID=1802061 RepID=A0A1F7IXX0_9BACT|nr:MAG: hypothetical protein A2861_00220 [Candidatus Roizmanbacteria bacterium RIFCSPHIGHO2_01_FULL_38_15]OGK36120.1 MAG: hypothetical protein A3F59_01465 [Candidatus Roizmanbacteria bacterium RIFCSPHIGHO2_12_FULL_38_13]OGK48165.1 MAG: hypothetical protein A3A93_00540 [Candidatus Roizmanbacteria bacterium RIFCSPLOWO2_01_FULL_38_12]